MFFFQEKDKLADVASSLSFDLSFGLVKSCGRDLCPVLNNSIQASHTTEVRLCKLLAVNFARDARGARRTLPFARETPRDILLAG